jgi:hypothetical protein
MERIYRFVSLFYFNFLLLVQGPYDSFLARSEFPKSMRGFCWLYFVLILFVGVYGTDEMRNGFHGSDSENVAKEIDVVFPGLSDVLMSEEELPCSIYDRRSCRFHNDKCIWYYSDIPSKVSKENENGDYDENGECKERELEFYMKVGGSPLFWGLLIPIILWLSLVYL